MKLSNTTLAILKNFSEINSNLTINPGNELKTIHVPPTIYATAQVEEVFDKVFGIYDLKNFLATLAMFKNPDLTFNDNYIDIIDDDDPSIRTKYWNMDVNVLTKLPQLKQFPDPVTTFKITNLNFKRIQRACNTLKCPDVVFEGKDGKIVAIVCDLANNTQNKNSFTAILHDDYTGPDFNVHLKQEKLMIIDGDYACSLIMDKLIKLNHAEKPIEYVVTLDI